MSSLGKSEENFRDFSVLGWIKPKISACKNCLFNPHKSFSISALIFFITENTCRIHWYFVLMNSRFIEIFNWWFFTLVVTIFPTRDMQSQIFLFLCMLSIWGNISYSKSNSIVFSFVNTASVNSIYMMNWILIRF